MSKLLEKDA
jgi:hypothetical protein